MEKQQHSGSETSQMYLRAKTSSDGVLGGTSQMYERYGNGAKQRRSMPLLQLVREWTCINDVMD